MTLDSPKVGVVGRGFTTDVFHMPCLKQLRVDVIAVATRSEGAGKKPAKQRMKKGYREENVIEALCEDHNATVRLRRGRSAR